MTVFEVVPHNMFEQACGQRFLSDNIKVMQLDTSTCRKGAPVVSCEQPIWRLLDDSRWTHASEHTKGLYPRACMPSTPATVHRLLHCWPHCTTQTWACGTLTHTLCFPKTCRLSPLTSTADPLCVHISQILRTRCRQVAFMP